MYMVYKVFWIVLVGFLIEWGTALPVYAQETGTITGEITDENTGQVLPGANVRIDGLSKGR